MKFGALDQIDGVTFRLPGESVENSRVLEALPKKKTTLFIGAPVWTAKGFVGTLYPAKTKTKDYLQAYGQQFNSIELNATHYRIPSMDTVQSWSSVVPEHFKFSPKVPQVVSHRKDLSSRMEVMDQFLEAVYGFGDRLGTSFLQLPPYFSPANLDDLYRFLSALPQDFELAVEVRHADWFKGDGAGDELFSMLETTGYYTVISDVAGRRDVLHQRLTGGKVMVRFNGNNGHATDETRLQEWCDQLKKWVEAGMDEIYFFVHQPDKANLAATSTFFIQEMNRNFPGLISPLQEYGENNLTLF